ncbi:hypothetical protein G6045_18205 [Streptomyces sp. YC504]|uniref:DUF3558 domain-containing protein n=1 Tax=Streptomyces mesophilus TaxID=1775132 RepID=A0A6G4XJ31_9ACTN|nr:hypothetical protein [Streptomyces mesophilus]NGO77576.1 hypothetical protein [Streptomyces mesophilus]
MRIVISRRPVRAGCLATAVAGLLCLGATGCTGDKDEKVAAADKDVAGTQLCGGHAVSAEASKALKVIMGSSQFGTTGEKSTVAQAARDVVEAGQYSRRTDGRDDVCRIYTADDTSNFALRVTWGLESGPPTKTPAPDFTVLKMGEQTLAAANRATVRFGCRSDNFTGSPDATHVAVGVEHWGMPTEPDGDEVEALKDAYATVAHSFALAMAKELGCEKDGGLPARPVLEPA